MEFDHLSESRQLEHVVLEILTDLATLQSHLEDKIFAFRLQMLLLTARSIQLRIHRENPDLGDVIV